MFQITKPHKISETFIDNASAHSAYGVSFELQPTTSEYLSSTTFLNSNIPEDSNIYSMLMELKKIDPELTRTLVHMKEEDLRAHFTKHAKNFSTHTFINFLTGFTLSDQEFASFTKDEPLDVRRFEALLGTYDRGYSVANNLLLREKEARLSLLHTIGTVHLMELYVGKVAQVPEEHRNPIKLCPKTGNGIAKRMLVNVKNDAIRWMVAKMQVRRSLLPNYQNFDVLNMLRFSLWGPDIFPKEAFDELKAKYPGKSSLDALLDISPKLPEDITKDTGDKTLNLPNQNQKASQFPNPRKGNNKRGTRGGRNRNRARNGSQQYNQAQNRKGTPQTQTGYNQPRGNQNRNSKQSKKGGKPFQKGKQSNSQ